METSRAILFAKSDHVGTITFNRPKANSYESNFMRQFNEVIDAASADDDVHVVIVRSALERFFSGGADIQVFAKNSPEANKQMVSLARQALRKIEASGKVFIAALNGHTLGGGLEIAMACDLRFGGDGSYLIGLPEVKLGLMPGNGGSQRLSRIVGVAKAIELAITGDSVMPREAFRMGLLNRLIPGPELARETEVFAKTLASGAPLAMAAIKRSVRDGTAMNLEDGLALEAALVETLYHTADAREGFVAYTEKRPPLFQGH